MSALLLLVGVLWFPGFLLLPVFYFSIVMLDFGGGLSTVSALSGYGQALINGAGGDDYVLN